MKKGGREGRDVRKGETEMVRGKECEQVPEDVTEEGHEDREEFVGQFRSSSK